MPQKPKSIDIVTTIREEDAAIAAENRKIEERERVRSEGEAEKAESAIRELKRPTNLS